MPEPLKPAIASIRVEIDFNDPPQTEEQVQQFIDSLLSDPVCDSLDLPRPSIHRYKWMPTRITLAQDDTTLH